MDSSPNLRDFKSRRINHLCYIPPIWTCILTVYFLICWEDRIRTYDTLCPFNINTAVNFHYSENICYKQMLYQLSYFSNCWNIRIRTAIIWVRVRYINHYTIFQFREFGGARTHDHLNHNQALCQLSYKLHMWARWDSNPHALAGIRFLVW